MNLKNIIDINVRSFPVKVRDMRSGTESAGHIVLTKEQLQAAALVGMTQKELIRRTYGRLGYKVLDIGVAVKRRVDVDLYAAPGEIVIEGKAMLTAAEVVQDAGEDGA